MFIIVTIAIFTGIIATFATRSLAPYLEIDALLARGGLAVIFTTFAGLYLLDRIGTPTWSMTLAPIAGMLGFDCTGELAKCNLQIVHAIDAESRLPRSSSA